MLRAQPTKGIDMKVTGKRFALATAAAAAIAVGAGAAWAFAESDERISNEVGVLLAKRSDDLVKACKGKPAVLMTRVEKETESEAPEDENVAPFVANQ